MASRKPDSRQHRYQPGQDAEAGHPCSREPPELCDGARLVTQDDGTSKRVPALTPRAFCEPCERRIVTCLEELPSAYERLAARIGDPVQGTAAIRVMPGSRVLVNPDIDALMRTMAAVLEGWAARVRMVPGLQLADTGHAPGSAEAVADACDVLAKHPAPLLSLQDGWTTRTFTFPAAPPSASAAVEGICRRCGRRVARLVSGKPDRWYLMEPARGPVSCAHKPREVTASRALALIPAELEEWIGNREIVSCGDGWVKVMDCISGADAGNEILEQHWRSRRLLGEMKVQPESFDGIPCKACDELALERAEPPSDPSLPAMHSKCALCKDEMDREEFAQWADMYASWARGAGIQACRRCTIASRADTSEKRARMHAGCCWAACSCDEGEHPRRRSVA